MTEFKYITPSDKEKILESLSPRFERILLRISKASDSLSTAGKEVTRSEMTLTEQKKIRRRIDIISIKIWQLIDAIMDIQVSGMY